MRNHQLILIFALLFFTVETLYAQRGVIVRRQSPQRQQPSVLPETSRQLRQVPERPTDRSRNENSRFNSNNSNNNNVLIFRRPNESARTSSDMLENLRSLDLQERYFEVESSLNHRQSVRLERSISRLAEYARSTPLSSRQSEFVEKLGEAILLSPTHGFISEVIRTLANRQLISPDKITGIMIILNEAKSFITRTVDHGRAMNRALARSGYSKSNKGEWCI